MAANFLGAAWSEALVAYVNAAFSGALSSGPQAYTLLSAAAATGSAISGIRGGDYIWRVSGTFGGGTATLQALDLDGTTWVNVKAADGTTDITATAAKSVGVGIGQGATMRVMITGATGASLNSTLAGLS